MKRTMYEAARHTPKEEVGGSNPFRRAIWKKPVEKAGIALTAGFLL